MSPATRRLAPLWRPLLAAFALLVSAQALAAGSHTIDVSAVVLSKNTCRFTTAGPTALAFPAIDPAQAGNSVASASTTFRCNGSSAVAVYSVTSDDGLNETGLGQPRMLHTTAAGNFLPYSLNLPANGSTPRNVVTTLTVTGTITPAQFANALPGSYTDTVVMTIQP